MLNVKVDPRMPAVCWAIELELRVSRLVRGPELAPQYAGVAPRVVWEPHRRWRGLLDRKPSGTPSAITTSPAGCAVARPRAARR